MSCNHERISVDRDSMRISFSKRVWDARCLDCSEDIRVEERDGKPGKQHWQNKTEDLVWTKERQGD